MKAFVKFVVLVGLAFGDHHHHHTHETHNHVARTSNKRNLN